jgi:hypothetical protein
VLFYCGNANAAPGNLTAFSIHFGVLHPIGNSTDSFHTMGSIPMVSSYMHTNGIVWAVNRGTNPTGDSNQITLQAYDALDVTQSLHSKGGMPGGWPIGNWGHGRAFVVPTVMNGKVYVACEDRIGVFY